MATHSCTKSTVQAMKDAMLRTRLYVSIPDCRVHVVSQPPPKYYHREWPYKGIELLFVGGGGTGKGVLRISLAGEVWPSHPNPDPF